jgi:nudix-type nucleoside diphosphatase (YffH/AdpP family)
LPELFLPPPFDSAALRAVILGPGAPPLPARPAWLEGYAVRADADALRVALVPDAGGRVAGVLVSLPPVARDRFDFALAVLGARAVPVRTGTEGGAVAAEAYVFEEAAAHAGPWPGEPCPEERRARFAEALAEVMGHFIQRDASEVRALLHGIGIRALARTRGAGSRVPAVLGSHFGDADVAPITRHFSYARFFGMEEHRLRHRRFDGTMSEEIDRAVFTSGDAITVLPFDPRAGTVLLIEQFRAGPHARRDPRPWSLETVAGRCDKSEPPEATARREAREEADLELGRIERIAAFYPSPGIVAEHITAFVAEADLGAAGGLHGLAEEHEDIRTLVVPLDTALTAMAAGEVNPAPLLISLLGLERTAARLAAAWT